jgi:dinuclear metal center YbgI/SA1388 family protein
MNRAELTNFLTTYLMVNDYSDDCPNGLQVAGNKQVKTIVTAVSASVELFEQAINEKADTLIVHHGIIWNFERPLYIGGYRERVKLLLENNMNLYAFHLPLDAHPEIGNNALLCSQLGVQKFRPFGDYKGQNVGMFGEINRTGKKSFFKKVKDVVGQEPVIFDYGPDEIKTVGIISGGAQKQFKDAINIGLDAFVTGEVSEHIMHYAKEEQIHFIAAGHYATEIFGIRALGNLLQKKFNLQVTFVDIYNPV